MFFNINNSNLFIYFYSSYKVFSNNNSYFKLMKSIINSISDSQGDDCVLCVVVNARIKVIYLFITIYNMKQIKISIQY
jgi:hypothetical protein